MPSFADSFWDDGVDLFIGMRSLFEQLRIGCDQNDLFIQLFASRMQFEVNHGRHLCSTRNGIDSFDVNGNSIIQALDSIIEQMIYEGDQHLVIASNIEEAVLKPFSKWSEEHRKRVEYSEKILKKNITSFAKSKKQVDKLEQIYFNKCRSLEDFKREYFSDDESLTLALNSLKLQKEYDINLLKEKEFQKFGTFGGSITLDYKSAREVVHSLLIDLEKHDYRVPLINYVISNTNNGSEIAKFLFEHMKLKDLDQAELFGQDLMNKGFFKCCNGVGSSFVNSKKFQYQWKAYAYDFARTPFSGGGSGDIFTSDAASDSILSAETNKFSSYIQDITSKISSSEPDTPKSVNIMGSENQQYDTDTPPSTSSPHLSEEERVLQKLLNEVEVADSNYHKECIKLDSLRCSIEELIVDHYNFMEKCETDRLAAVKKVTLDFCAALGNKISSLKIAIERMIASNTSMDPTSDILNLIANNRTGFFQPRVIPYNNYYNPGGYQLFGIDLETRSRLDKKTVPVIVSTILSYMDQVYPELESDNQRITIWTEPVKLQATHQLRKALNDKPAASEDEILEIFEDYKASPSLIASVLKIYLLELPSSLISSEIYDIMKSLYSEYPPLTPGEAVDSPDPSQKANDTKRIQGIINTLATLSKPRIATLDAITNHFYRLDKILKMSESEESKALAKEFAVSISLEFANCIIQVKLKDGNDLGFKIFHDLLTYKKQVFRDLKRQGSRNAKSRTSSQTDEDPQFD